MDSPLAGDRVAAMSGRAEAEVPETDANQYRSLIEQLDHDDPVVRLVAIGRLERETGTDLGFRYDDPLSARQAAVARWVAWYDSRFAPREE
jgi:hypothetical protein